MTQRSGITIQNAVYQELKTGIMSMKLKPGTVISAQEIATRLNVSRTPVREAFVSLQSEGLVDIQPQKGTVVSRLDLDRVEQERCLREALEISAIEPFIEHKTPIVIDRMHALLDEQIEAMESKQYSLLLEKDNAFHGTIFETAGRNLAWDVIRRNNGHYDRLRVLTVNNSKTAIGAIKQHEEMIALLQDGNAEGVKHLLWSHVRKINYEKLDLLKNYKDYFETTDQKTAMPIGSL